MKGTLRSILVVTTLCGFAASAFATEIHVPADYDTIQAAINAASDGDDIVVDDGTYNEAIDFLGKAVTLRSQNGPDYTTIDGTIPGTTVVTCASGEGPDTILDGFTITGGSGQAQGADIVGGGMYNYAADPTVQNCVFISNQAESGAGMWNFISRAAIISCSFVSNNGHFGEGGAGMYNFLGAPTIIDCTFVCNAQTGSGGGMKNDCSSPYVVNCIFFGNTATFGAGAYNTGGSQAFVNCTFSENAADPMYDSNGGGIKNGPDCTTLVIGSLVWDNTPSEIHDSWGVASEVYYSDVRGGWEGVGHGNIGEDLILHDPLFVDAENGNLRLSADSPCIDAGDTMAFLEFGLDCDLDGNPRPVDGGQGGGDGGPGLFRRCYRVFIPPPRVDMGAYEYQP